ncbi:MAG TPA: PKD domain-containing protein [Anaerolineales bacterium]|nr:PKD domain-containing protein [Anaerolineales bacterium]
MALGLLGGFFLLTVSMLRTVSAAPSAWVFQTVDTGGNPNEMALDSQGYAHFVYVQGTALRYAYQDLSGWHTQPIDTGINTATQPDLALDSAGVPHVSYHKAGNVMHAYLSGDTWTLEPVGTALNPTKTSIAINPLNQQPSIAYDSGNFEVHRLIYAYHDTAWHPVDVDLNFAGRYNEMVFDSTGHPHLSYESLSGVTYATITPGGVWDIQWIGGSLGFIWAPDIAVDSTGHPAISFLDTNSSQIFFAHLVNNTWDIQSVDSFSAFGYTSPALEFAPNDIPYLAYHHLDQSQIVLAFWNQTAWDFMEVTSPGTSGDYTTLGFEASGVMHVGFFQNNNTSLIHALEGGAITGLTASNDSPTFLGETTHLTATVTTGENLSYTWDYGDGAIGNDFTHIYPDIGTYTATVTATNTINQAVASTLVTIFDQPISGLNLQTDSPTSLGAATTFTATIQTGSHVTFTWDFGDGESETGPVISHTYAHEGTYSITLTASNSAGNVTTSAEVQVVASEYTIFLPICLK